MVFIAARSMLTSKPLQMRPWISVMPSKCPFSTQNYPREYTSAPLGSTNILVLWTRLEIDMAGDSKSSIASLSTTSKPMLPCARVMPGSTSSKKQVRFRACVWWLSFFQFSFYALFILDVYLYKLYCHVYVSDCAHGLAAPSCPVEWVDAEHPLFMLYTRWSAGRHWFCMSCYIQLFHFCVTPLCVVGIRSREEKEEGGG